MKKLILGLILIITAACAQAQKTDSTYVADSSVYIADIDKGIALQGTKNYAEFVFRRNSTLEIKRDSLFKVFVVDDIASTDRGEDYVITVYTGHIDQDTITLGVTMFRGKLWAVGIFRYNDGVIFYIKGRPNDTSDDAGVVGRVGRSDSTGIWGSSNSNNTELPQ